MKNVRFRRIKRAGKRIARGAKRFALGAALISTLLLPFPGRAEEKIEPPKKPKVSLKTGAGVDLLSRSPRATIELDLAHPLQAGFLLEVNFGIASNGPFNQGTQPELQLEQIDVTLSSPKLGPLILTTYIQNSTHLATVLTGGGNAVVEIGPLIGVVGIQKNIEGPLPAYAMLVAPIKGVITLGAEAVKVLNGDVVGLRANAALTIRNIPEIYVDLFMLGTPGTRQMIFQDLTAGLKFDF